MCVPGECVLDAADEGELLLVVQHGRLLVFTQPLAMPAGSTSGPDLPPPPQHIATPATAPSAVAAVAAAAARAVAAAAPPRLHRRIEHDDSDSSMTEAAEVADADGLDDLWPQADDTAAAAATQPAGSALAPDASARPRIPALQSTSWQLSSPLVSPRRTHRTTAGEYQPPPSPLDALGDAAAKGSVLRRQLRQAQSVARLHSTYSLSLTQWLATTAAKAPDSQHVPGASQRTPTTGAAPGGRGTLSDAAASAASMSAPASPRVAFTVEAGQVHKLPPFARFLWLNFRRGAAAGTGRASITPRSAGARGALGICSQFRGRAGAVARGL